MRTPTSERMLGALLSLLIDNFVHSRRTRPSLLAPTRARSRQLQTELHGRPALHRACSSSCYVEETEPQGAAAPVQIDG